MNPYEGYKLYGPYVHRFSKRKIVYLRNSEDDRIYLNLSRYVMEMHLGERLSPQQDVHHVNGDKTDDRLENLEVIHRAPHNSSHAVEANARRIRNKSGQFVN